jgi:ABC-type nitrate/sulfonate/bicarbonate transport system substrate-binding protein
MITEAIKMNLRKQLFLIVVMVLVISLTGTGCGPKTPAGDENLKVTVVLDWVPNTNHTGLFVALEKGWYAAAGLDVEIIQPGETGAAQLVAANKAQFGVSYQEEVTLARSSAIPIVSVGAIIQPNTSAFASAKAQNITRPKDFEGKRYGGWGSPIEEAVIRAMMENDGGNFDLVEFVSIGSLDFFNAIERDVDFAWIFEGWDGVRAELTGFELNLVRLRDFHPALNYYTPVLIASEKNIENNPEMVKAFMDATAKGYSYAAGHPQEAADILLTYAPELDSALVYASQEWLADKYSAGTTTWGLQQEDVWERYAAWLLENGQLPVMIKINEAFTNSFLPE